MSRRNLVFIMSDQQRRDSMGCYGSGWAQTPNEHIVQTTAQGQPPDWVERANRELPFGRLVQPDEVARAVAFLTSEESGLMTGALVDFDQYVIGAFQEPPRPAPLES